MTEQEKQLLSVDLCARLPYSVQGITSEGVVSPLLTRGEADWDILTSLNYRIVKHGWKPYLRPMSSMTEDEKSYMEELSDFKCTPDKASQKIDFYNSHHIDYRGLIPMGLAFEAPEGMYK